MKGGEGGWEGKGAKPQLNWYQKIKCEQLQRKIKGCIKKVLSLGLRSVAKAACVLGFFRKPWVHFE